MDICWTALNIGLKKATRRRFKVLHGFRVRRLQQDRRVLVEVLSKPGRSIYWHNQTFDQSLFARVISRLDGIDQLGHPALQGAGGVLYQFIALLVPCYEGSLFSLAKWGEKY
jgi:hypothetical protein